MTNHIVTVRVEDQKSARWGERTINLTAANRLSGDDRRWLKAEIEKMLWDSMVKWRL